MLCAGGECGYFARGVAARLVVLCMAMLSIQGARAEGALPSPLMSGRAELWTGAEATRHAWSGYSGVNWSPFGALQDNGFRLRLVGGYGEYRYRTAIDGRHVKVNGVANFADLLAGYQMGLGAMTLKAYAGATFDGHVLEPFDAGNPVNGRATGAKGVIEGWLNLTTSAWAQVDAAYGTAHSAYSSRLRLGYRLNQGVSLGVEGGAFGNAASDSGRGGGFARYEWLGGEMSVSGGVSGDIEKPRNPYGTLTYLMRF